MDNNMEKNQKKVKILLSGGGTIGSVSPLIAIKQELDKQQIQAEYLWIGTENGIEKDIVSKQNIEFKSINSGKLRRYFSVKNFLAPWHTFVGIIQALRIINKFKPDIILTAGSFVCVPVAIAGWLSRKIVVVHQQDLKIGLANKLMVPFAKQITVTFEKSIKDYKAKKVVWTGNPVRQELFSGDIEQGRAMFNLEAELPTLLVIGGSLGSEIINKTVFSSVPELIKTMQIIHITGKGQVIEWVDKEKFGTNVTRYHSQEYLYDELVHAYAVADLVVCRAGMSTMTELSALNKPMVVIPIPDNQQEENAQFFDSKNAIILLEQKSLTEDQFITIVQGLFNNPNSLARLKNNLKSVMLPDANIRYSQLIKELLKIN